MSTYYFLQDAQVGIWYVQAGSTWATLDAGGQLPAGWKPGPYVDPLDTPAVNAFYAQGPQEAQILIRQRFYGIPVNAPVTYWTQISHNRWALTGLGANQVTYPPVTANVPSLP